MIIRYAFEFETLQPFVELFESENERGFVRLELQIVAERLQELREYFVNVRAAVRRDVSDGRQYSDFLARHGQFSFSTWFFIFIVV